MDLPKPTEEMLVHFLNRTNKHIQRVQDNMIALSGVLGLTKEELEERGRIHDADKFSDEFKLAYIWITEYYRAKRCGELTPELKKIEKICDPYSESHLLSNPHHPEYYLDVNQMSDLDLVEMASDWTAMAQEFNEPSAKGWANKNIGKKWEFNSEKTKKIYDIIDETIKRGIV